MTYEEITGAIELEELEVESEEMTDTAGACACRSVRSTICCYIRGKYTR